MSSLRELQEHCYRAFVLGDSAALQPTVRNNEVSAEHRIQVYQNNARETFRKALLASFPVIERLVAAGVRLTTLSSRCAHATRRGERRVFARENSEG